jgi:hypothetical protein
MDSPPKRKVSPRAPTVALDEALTRTARMYKAEGRHPTPLSVALKHIGYNSKNGAALQAIASLGYWGLIDRTRDGALVVSKAFEDLEFSPEEAQKRDLLIGFLRKPAVFASMLEKYQDRLPSDATIKYDLIQRGFSPSSADVCLSVFKSAVALAGYFDKDNSSKFSDPIVEKEDESERPASPPTPAITPAQPLGGLSIAPEHIAAAITTHVAANVDRILVRLAPGRTAWLEIPVPFYSADKKRLKMHIDLLLTFDEENGEVERDA